jgi:hypothetical protein
MIALDFMIGSKAEFLNAFSVVQRLIGKEPTYGVSFVAQKVGTIGEFMAVILANVVIGGLLTSVVLVFNRSW